MLLRVKMFAFAALVAMTVGPLMAQTTSGLITGTITDPSGASISGASVVILNQSTGATRNAQSEGNGYYIFPQVEPGIYDISVSQGGFATVERKGLQIEVNQNATLDFALPLSSITETIEVSTAAPPLNTTSATLGTVIGRNEVVELPLNGRQFTQLTLLTPGAAPVEATQQKNNVISLGAGGVSPAVNGQRARNNNYTMDGVLNNEPFINVWAISPPPDAIQEFNVQSHITDAQFSISSGANINVVTRSGGPAFHGAAWEFARNGVFDAQQFPATARTPYSQNQYGLQVEGPVFPARMRGLKNTWFSGYWEGFRSSNTLSYLGNTLTDRMKQGDFSELLGAKVGTDDLQRPEYKNEIYDPTTSRVDPVNHALTIRDPFQGNIIQMNRISPDAAQYLLKYFPSPNLNVAEGVLPNLAFTGTVAKSSDPMGVRIDHRFGENDTIFGRYNRSNTTESDPESLPTYTSTELNYGEQYAVGYTHSFSATMLLALHYGYTNVNVRSLDSPAGIDFLNALNLEQWSPPQYGIATAPAFTLGNGFSGVAQTATISGPQKSSDYHADLTKVVGHHTFGAGGMYYHINNTSGGFGSSFGFTQTATSQGGLTNTTGFSPASFLLGLPAQYTVTAGNIQMLMTVNWIGAYAQDQWQVTKNLALSLGLRYDYVSPPNYSKTISAVDITNGNFLITQPSLPLYPTAVGSPHLFYPRYNGFQPRLGASYKATPRTVLHAAFAVMDDHNNTTVQLYANPRVSWPTALQTTITNLNQGLPTVSIDNMPSESTYLNPTTIYVMYGFDPHNRVAYSDEYNAGVEQQVQQSLVLDLDYVGSQGHNQLMQTKGNTAKIPGPGTLASRGQPYPQYTSAFNFDSNSGPASYNALQGKLTKSLSSGLFLMASYTWSKSLDIQSDAYAGVPENIYNLHGDWGPSDYNVGQIFVLSSVYRLPFGSGGEFLARSSGIVRSLVSDWNIGTIASMSSGLPFDATVTGDVANVGGGTQRANRIGNPYGGVGFFQGHTSWVNAASFTSPAAYTFGSEGRNDLVGPSQKDVDLTVYRNVHLKRATVELRSEFFNLFNHTNYGLPAFNQTAATFGQITSAGPGREIQFAAKVKF